MPHLVHFSIIRVFPFVSNLVLFFIIFILCHELPAPVFSNLFLYLCTHFFVISFFHFPTSTSGLPNISITENERNTLSHVILTVGSDLNQAVLDHYNYDCVDTAPYVEGQALDLLFNR